MFKEVQRKCPLCGSREGDILYTQHFGVPDNSELPPISDIVCCTKCYFVYSDSSATQQEYDRFYEEMSKYEDPGIATGSGVTTWDRERLNDVANELIKYINYDSTVLDIGCANGGLLQILKESGYHNVTGMDKSISCINYLRGRHGIRAIQGGLFDKQFDDELFSNQRFDLIILSHVLEHVYDLNSALAFVLRKLKDTGLLYIETPDASRYWKYPNVPFYYFDSEHINHFDLFHLRMLAEFHGFGEIYSKEKEIPVSSTQIYPAVSLLMRHGANNLNKPLIVINKALMELVKEYIEISSSEKFSKNIDILADSMEEVIVFGAGSYTQRLLGDSRLSECNILAYVDNDRSKQGMTLEGVKILSPKYLRETNCTILVCSALHTLEIVNQIKQMKITRQILSPTKRF